MASNATFGRVSERPELADDVQRNGLLGALVVCFLLALFFHSALGIPQTWGYALAGAFLVAVGRLTSFSMGSLLLFVLFVAHVLVGAVELGTDGWIQNITGNI